MADAAYLDDLSFSEPHTGPAIRDSHGNVVGHDPSPAQIRRMCAAIRATWTALKELQALGRTADFDEWFQRHAPSESTHVPHGIAAETIGAERCRDLML